MLSDEIIAKIVARLPDERLYSICADLNINYSIIRKQLIQMGVKYKMERTCPRTVSGKRAFQLLDTSMTDVSIAHETGLSRERIRQIRKKNNKPQSPLIHSRCSSLSEKYLGELMRSLKARKPLAQIAQELGTTVHTVYYVCRTHGIQIRQYRLLRPRINNKQSKIPDNVFLSYFREYLNEPSFRANMAKLYKVSPGAIYSRIKRLNECGQITDQEIELMHNVAGNFCRTRRYKN